MFYSQAPGPHVCSQLNGEDSNAESSTSTPVDLLGVLRCPKPSKVHFGKQQLSALEGFGVHVISHYENTCS